MEALTRDRRDTTAHVDALIVVFALLPVFSLAGRYVQTWSDATPPDLAGATLASATLAGALGLRRRAVRRPAHPDGRILRRYAAGAATFATLAVGAYAAVAPRLVFALIAAAGGLPLLAPSVTR
jgi:hypothetical protein